MNIIAIAQTNLVRKAARYFVVGGICALTDWVIFAAFFYFSDLHYLYAATISFLVSTGLNYLLSVRFVFNSGRRARHHEVMLVYLVSLGGIFINLAVLGALVELVGVHPLLAKIVASGAGFGWNFGTRYWWIFYR